MDTVRRIAAPGDAVRRMRALKSAACWSALAAGLAPMAAAQQSPPPPSAPPATSPDTPAATTPAEGVQVFEAAYFQSYNPVTAADMVSRIPGFDIDDGEVLRGFGATAGNVLVNGERPSSKVLMTEQLKRIPADAVARVELISGSASNVDVRGQTQLANVVLKKSTQASSPTTWVAEARHIQYSERIGWILQATKGFSLGETAELSIDLQAPNLRGRTEAYEGVRNALGDLTQYREQFGQPNNIGLQGSGVLKWRPTARDTVSFNAQYAPTWNTLSIGSVARTPAGGFLQATYGDTDYTNNFTGEIAGDWEHRFSPQLSAKVLALATFTGVDQADVYETYRPVGLVNTQSINRTTEGGERVVRGVVTWKPSAAHTVDLGLEGAFNARDTTLDIFNDAGAGPVAQPLPVANVKIEELRGEAFITDVWKLSPQVSLETGFTFEASRITQSGDEVNEREFTYPKPRMTATWQAAETDQLRASFSREVAQLDFAEFGSTLAVIDNSTTIGNPDLEPEKAWKLRGEWEHKFGKRGALTAAVFHDEVEDVQDFVSRTICLGPGSVALGTCAVADQRVSDAFGNLGGGTRTGIEVRGAAPLAPLGIPNAEVRFSGLWQETSVTDPQTGQDRSFSSEKDWNYLVSFRQELPGLKAAWGASALRTSLRTEFRRLEEISYDRPGDKLDLFVETTRIKGITLRLQLSNIMPTAETRVRTFYTPDRSSGILLRTETRDQKGGPDGTRVIAIRASGSF